MTDGSSIHVIVSDVKMPFLSMVIFMVKWAIASVPALMILIIMGTAVFQILMYLLGMLGGGMHGPWHTSLHLS
jgi:hypothetical protein